MIENLLKEIAQQYSKIDSVYAVVLSGSRTSNQSDELSDYDIYVYTDKEIPLDFRTELARKYSDDFEINNQYFETGDEWNLRDYPSGLDFMFRSPEWIESCIENVWRKHYASLGYTTCFLHNVYTSKILYDKNGWFLNLQNTLSAPYPDGLRKNIIKKNMMLLKDKKGASYLEQVENAVKRNDIVSINHRITAFVSSYFDVLFAINRIFHPGEKRLITFSKNRCTLLPDKFEANFEKLYNSDKSKKVEILDEMVSELKKILPQETK